MKASDTELSRLEQIRIINTHPAEELCKRQAEVSFKAGYEQGVEFLELTSETQFKAGIKEVVELLHIDIRREIRPDGTEVVVFRLDGKDWQSKLKEWGIE